MCNSCNCRHKKKAPPEPKYFVHYIDDYGEEFSFGGETPAGVLEKLRGETGDIPVVGIKIYEVARAGTASVTIEWDK